MVYLATIIMYLNKHDMMYLQSDLMCSYVKNTNYTYHILQLICQNGGPEVVVNCVRN